MVIPDLRLSPVCSARASALRGQQRTAEPIPNWLRVSTQLTLHPAGTIVKTCRSEICILGSRWVDSQSKTNRQGADDSVGACANCFAGQRASLAVQDSVASAPRFDVGEIRYCDSPDR